MSRNFFGYCFCLSTFLTVALAGEPSPNPRPGEKTLSFFLDTTLDTVAITNNGMNLLAPFPAGIPLFDEPNIQPGLAILAKIRNESGEVIGFASELEDFPPEGPTPEGELRWKTAWTLVIPGRGSIFLDQIEDVRELLTLVVFPTLATGIPFEGEYTAIPTDGPRFDGRGVIVGGTGDFKRLRGSFVEIATVTRFDPMSVPDLELTLELRLFYRGRTIDP